MLGVWIEGRPPFRLTVSSKYNGEPGHCGLESVNFFECFLASS